MEPASHVVNILLCDVWVIPCLNGCKSYLESASPLRLDFQDSAMQSGRQTGTYDSEDMQLQSWESWKWRNTVPLKRWYQQTKRHGTITRHYDLNIHHHPKLKPHTSASLHNVSLSHSQAQILSQKTLCNKLRKVGRKKKNHTQKQNTQHLHLKYYLIVYLHHCQPHYLVYCMLMPPHKCM